MMYPLFYPFEDIVLNEILLLNSFSHLSSWIIGTSRTATTRITSRRSIAAIWRNIFIRIHICGIANTTQGECLMQLNNQRINTINHTAPRP